MTSRSLRESLAKSLLEIGRRHARAGAQAFDVEASAIVFAPHADDEVLGCGGTIALKVQAGAPVQVVIMTDGRSSHAQFIDPDTLARMRRDEALDAARALGVDPSNYRFLEFTDGHLRQFIEPAAERAAQLLAQYEPKQVFVPSRRDRLADHEATYHVVRAALRAYRKAVTLFEYPVWLWNTWPWAATRPTARELVRAPALVRDVIEIAFGCRERIDIRSVRERKRTALEQYRSQMARPPGSPDWPILADVSHGSFLTCFETSEEVFRRSQFGVT